MFETNSNLNITITDLSSQHLTISLQDSAECSLCLLTGIYASTNYAQRRVLWYYLTSKAPTTLPWCIVGDFSSIISALEKLSLGPSRLNLDFLQDMGFTGNKFSWSNNRRGTSYVAARLDQALCNNQ